MIRDIVLMKLQAVGLRVRGYDAKRTLRRYDKARGVGAGLIALDLI